MRRKEHIEKIEQSISDLWNNGKWSNMVVIKSNIKKTQRRCGTYIQWNITQP